jgi:hypothetical protein
MEQVNKYIQRPLNVMQGTQSVNVNYGSCGHSESLIPALTVTYNMGLCNAAEGMEYLATRGNPDLGFMGRRFP